MGPGMIDFPTAIPGETFQAAGLVWQYDGIKWIAATIVEEEPGNVPAPVTVVVSVSTVLADDFAGTVLVQQAAPVTITLPVTPALGQTVTIKDSFGQAVVNPISIVGIIEGVSGLVISRVYSWATLTWAGAHWVQV